MLANDLDIGKILVEDKKLTKEQCEDLRKEALKANLTLEETIENSGLVDLEMLANVKARVLKMDYVSLMEKSVDRKVLEIIPQKLAKYCQMLSIGVDKKAGVLEVAMVNPQDQKSREASRYIAREHNLKLKYYLTDKESFTFLFKKYLNISEEVGEALESAKERFEALGVSKKVDDRKIKDVKELQEVIKNAPVAKMVQVIMRHAVEGKASDIHIEPLDKITRVRFRVDGSLSTSISLPIYVHDALIARVKVMANLKIDETRIPQDGRIRLETKDRDIEFRVSTLPLQNHEKVVMRVLDTGNTPPTLDKLGYLGRNSDVIKKNLLKPNGMLLVTGPTGSGKSMTLFACLSIINSEDVNICTLEDPVEYRLSGVNHSQIKPGVGFTFATGLRSLLRQDPDIIMVGEIRDFETVELVIQAAMTGHLVLSTLHTNSAIGAIPRLIDMKAEPYLLTSTLNVIIAQRLVKTICSDCKGEVQLDTSMVEHLISEIKTLPDEIIATYGGVNLDKPVFYHGKGCARCARSGFKGRIAICEIIDVNSDIKKLIINGMKPEEVNEVLEKQQFVTMRQDGLIKSLLGYTTPEEVLSVTKVDD